MGASPGSGGPAAAALLEVGELRPLLAATATADALLQHVS